MSEENVEIVRRAYEAWNEGGPESIKRFMAENVEFHDPPNLPDPRGGARQGCCRRPFDGSGQGSRRHESGPSSM